MPIRLEHLLSGRIGVLAEAGHRSAIFKTAVDGPCRLEREGLAGDQQADRRWHGGPERALLHYPAEHYATWRAELPAFSADFVVGAFGENLSTHGLSEDTVYIGQRFRLGSALIEVSQPRRPCWKLDHRFDRPGFSRTVEATRRSGWLYRVLETGSVRAGDEFIAAGDTPGAPSVREVWDAWLRTPPDPRLDAFMAATPTLAAVWRQAFAQRRH
ncbi:MOSC domain-containing protein [Plasticicumulans acidivorans]|uniref:MOSC domain-containing protein YiiM n=1 Tax=Plasticicumulans acidivorans TaxID=886464 RepID=A0A317N0I3_9GAMM|nr:MOSC domain-containing protein [Plasticicumulans acidivorans]PWV65976.1 MOSC domain-containing protein YiiM [Plasticicumulans acidivorans]